MWRRRQRHPTPVFLSGKSHGQRSLVGCSPWGREESDTTERLHFHFSLSCIGEGNGNPLQCSCLENPRDGGVWWAAVCGVAQSRTRLTWLSSSSQLKWYLMVVVCVSLVTNDVEYLLMYLLTICTSFLLLLLSVSGFCSFNIFGISVFSQTVVCSFISLVVSFDEQKCLILMKIQLISFVFHSYCSVSYEIFASQRCFLLEDLS